MEYKTIDHLILLNHFLHSHDIRPASAIIGNSLEDYWPFFRLTKSNKELFVSSLSDLSKVMTISRVTETEAITPLSSINSLTLSQRHCLLFLMAVVRSHQACIIKGPTASGKSHIIRVFTKVIGKELVTIQVNSNTGIALLTGQFLPKADPSHNDIVKISALLQQLNTDVQPWNDIRRSFPVDDPVEWTPGKMQKVIYLQCEKRLSTPLLANSVRKCHPSPNWHMRILRLSRP
jgi:hypothetical protein